MVGTQLLRLRWMTEPGTATGWFRRTCEAEGKTCTKMSVKAQEHTLFRNFFIPLIAVNLFWKNICREISISMALEERGRLPEGKRGGGESEERHFKQRTASLAMAFTMESGSIKIFATILGYPISSSHSHMAMTKSVSEGFLKQFRMSLENICLSTEWKESSSLRGILKAI